MALPAAMETYQFAAQPRVVRSRKKYRDQADDERVSSNIMYDKRVVRGNTYATSVIKPQGIPQATGTKRIRSSQSKQQSLSARRPPGTPPPVDGRKHMDVQTDSYLEELSQKPSEAEMETQTDFLLDRPTPPLFMPAKSGVDVSTQIEEHDLFNFDIEVMPILEVLVGKTLEQGMMEVLEEEELAAMQKHQYEFEQLRNAQLVETQRMEAAEMRRIEEMERRKQQEMARLQQEFVFRRKVAARALAKDYLKNLQKGVFQDLESSGLFRDPILASIQEQFMPWLVDTAASCTAQARTSKALAEEIVAAAVEHAVLPHRQTLEAEANKLMAEVMRKKREREEAAREAAQMRLEEEETRRLIEEAARQAAEAERLAAEAAAAAAAAEAQLNEDGTPIEQPADGEPQADIAPSDGTGNPPEDQPLDDAN